MSAFEAADSFLPPAFDPARAARTLEELAGKGYVPAPQHLPLLNSAFGNSPYLARLGLRDHEFLQALLERGIEQSFVGVCSDANAAGNAADIDAAMATLRVAKRLAALTIALADISGAWAHHEVTGALTRFADVCVGAALRFLLRQQVVDAALADLSPERLEAQTGLVVLAM